MKTRAMKKLRYQAYQQSSRVTRLLANAQLVYTQATGQRSIELDLLTERYVNVRFYCLERGTV